MLRRHLLDESPSGVTKSAYITSSWLVSHLSNLPEARPWGPWHILLFITDLPGHPTQQRMEDTTLVFLSINYSPFSVTYSHSYENVIFCYSGICPFTSGKPVHHPSPVTFYSFQPLFVPFSHLHFPFFLLLPLLFSFLLLVPFFSPSGTIFKSLPSWLLIHSHHLHCYSSFVHTFETILIPFSHQNIHSSTFSHQILLGGFYVKAKVLHIETCQEMWHNPCTQRSRLVELIVSLCEFILLFIFNWRIIALQGCVGFHCTTMWIRYTYALPLGPLSHPSHPTHLDCHRAPSWAPCTI